MRRPVLAQSDEADAAQERQVMRYRRFLQRHAGGEFLHAVLAFGHEGEQTKAALVRERLEEIQQHGRLLCVHAYNSMMI